MRLATTYTHVAAVEQWVCKRVPQHPSRRGIVIVAINAKLSRNTLFAVLANAKIAFA